MTTTVLPAAQPMRVFLVVAVLAWNLTMWAGWSLGPWYPVFFTGLLLAYTSHRLVDVRPSLRVNLPGVVGAAVLLALMLMATYGGHALTRDWPVIGPSVKNLYAWMGAIGPVETVMLPVIILCEEIIWRGASLTWLSSRIGPLKGVVLMAAIYGCAHLLAKEPILAPVAFLCGIGWGLLRAYTGSLVAVFLCHYLWDLTILQLHPVQ